MLSDSFYVKVLFSSALLTLFCGVQNQVIEPKIVNGFNVTAMDGYKHQVSIRTVSDDRSRYGNGHRCGGSLISNRTVLTAAHCIHNGNKFMSASSFVVAMGSLYRYVRDNNTLYIYAARVVGHKSYNPKTFNNDIGVIILATEVPANHPTVTPIALASSKPVTGRSCIISGWGTLTYEGSQPQRLMAGQVVINSKSECNQPQRHNGNVLTGMFCAGSFSGLSIVDSCQGDSGGPLTCNGILTGVTSNGLECALPNYPGVSLLQIFFLDFFCNLI